MAKRKPQIIAPVGAHVLCGMPGISLPSDWFLATVLWTDGEEMLTEHTPAGQRDPCRQVLSCDYIRATGEISDLVSFQRAAQEAMREAARAVRDAEDALAEARQASWARLDQVCAQIGVPGQVAQAA